MNSKTDKIQIKGHNKEPLEKQLLEESDLKDKSPEGLRFCSAHNKQIQSDQDY